MSGEESEKGYGKPPKEHQFKKGQSGNPKGRPKGVKNFRTEAEKVLRSKVKVNQDGKPKTVGTVEAALMRLKEKALKGDPRALDRLLSLAQEISSVSDAGSREKQLSNLEESLVGRFDLFADGGDLEGSADE